MDREDTFTRMRAAKAYASHKNPARRYDGRKTSMSQEETEFRGFMAIMHPDKTAAEIDELAKCMDFS